MRRSEVRSRLSEVRSWGYESEDVFSSSPISGPQCLLYSRFAGVFRLSFSRHSRPLRLQMLPEKVFSGFEGSSDICVFLSLASPQCEKARFTTLSPCPTLALLVVLPSLARSACEVDRSAQHANPSCKAVCNGTAERAARTRRDTSKNGPTFSVHTQQGHFGEAGRGGLWES